MKKRNGHIRLEAFVAVVLIGGLPCLMAQSSLPQPFQRDETLTADRLNQHFDAYKDAAVDEVKSSGVGELTGGLIKTTFTQSFTNHDIVVADGDPDGTTSIIMVPDASASLDSIQVFLRITTIASPTGVLDIILIDPEGAEFTLQQGDAGAPAQALLQQAWTHESTLPAGNLGDWVGKNPAGNWTLKVIDYQSDQLAEDVRVEDWRLTFGGISAIAENNNTTELSGGLIVKGDMRIERPGGNVHLIKMGLWRVDQTNPTRRIIYFRDAEGVTHDLEISDPASVTQNAFIYYHPEYDGAGRDAAIFLNIDSSPSIACTLVNNEDDHPLSSKNLYWATDGGNNAGRAWGNNFTPTFMLMNEGVTGTIPIVNYRSYNIVCF